MAKEMHIWNSSLVSTSHASHNQIPMNRSSTFRRTWNEKKAPNQRYNANMLEDACSKSVKIGSAWRWTVSCKANFSVGFSFQKWQRANVQAATICNAFRRQFKNFFENVRESERRSETESSQVLFFFSQDYAMFCGLACDSIAMETGSKICVATVRLHTLHSHTKHPPINPPAEI